MSGRKAEKSCDRKWHIKDTENSKSETLEEPVRHSSTSNVSPGEELILLGGRYSFSSPKVQ
jgi:hypothetical protein